MSVAPHLNLRLFDDESKIGFRAILISAVVMTLIDSVTDGLVLYYWLQKDQPDVWWFVIGITFIFLSNVISFAFLNINCDLLRALAHLFGVGIIYEAVMS